MAQLDHSTPKNMSRQQVRNISQSYASYRKQKQIESPRYQVPPIDPLHINQLSSKTNSVISLTAINTCNNLLIRSSQPNMAFTTLLAGISYIIHHLNSKDQTERSCRPTPDTTQRITRFVTAEIHDTHTNLKPTIYLDAHGIHLPEECWDCENGTYTTLSTGVTEYRIRHPCTCNQ